MSESYKNSPKRRAWVKKYYKNYYLNPENTEIIKERTRKKYWINKFMTSEKNTKYDITYLKKLTSKELKELFYTL